MDNGKVNCKKCKNNVSPRLWHSNNRSIIFSRSTEHICPVCGKTMYTTGGGFSPLSLMLFYTIISIWGGSELEQTLRDSGLSNNLAGGISIIAVLAFLVAIIYITARLKKI